jgi:hypothetical protein
VGQAPGLRIARLFWTEQAGRPKKQARGAQELAAIHMHGRGGLRGRRRLGACPTLIFDGRFQNMIDHQNLQRSFAGAQQ